MYSTTTVPCDFTQYKIRDIKIVGKYKILPVEDPGTTYFQHEVHCLKQIKENNNLFTFYFHFQFEQRDKGEHNEFNDRVPLDVDGISSLNTSLSVAELLLEVHSCLIP